MTLLLILIGVFYLGSYCGFCFAAMLHAASRDSESGYCQSAIYKRSDN